ALVIQRSSHARGQGGGADRERGVDGHGAAQTVRGRGAVDGGHRERKGPGGRWRPGEDAAAAQGETRRQGACGLREGNCSVAVAGTDSLAVTRLIDRPGGEAAAGLDQERGLHLEHCAVIRCANASGSEEVAAAILDDPPIGFLAIRTAEEGEGGNGAAAVL